MSQKWRNGPRPHNVVKFFAIYASLLSLLSLFVSFLNVLTFGKSIAKIIYWEIDTKPIRMIKIV